MPSPAVRGDKRAFFDININGERAGRIVFALWNHCCPRTVENFRALCTGELGEMFGHRASYQGSIFHRVIKGFMIQGGDITHKNGQGGFSIHGRTFDDENLSLKHNKPYLLSMANRGPDTNGSQFFITTAATEHLDGKHVVFGEVIKGIEVVKMIENLEVGDEDKPLSKVQVVYAGEMVKKGGGVKDKEQDVEEKDDEPQGVKMDDEPATNNWLMRRSRSPPTDRKKKDSRGSSTNRHRRSGGDRHDRNRRSRSRSPRGGDRDRRDRRGRDEERGGRVRPTITTKDGVKVKGRGKVTFLGNRVRSATPPHWKKEESKKLTLDEHQKRQEEKEEREKRQAIRDKEYEERKALREKEQKEKEAQRELDRQKKEAEAELERQSSRYQKEDDVKREESSESSRSSSRASSDSSDSDSD